MAEASMSYSLSAEGTLLGCPSRITVGSHGGKIAFCGTVRWEGRKLSDVVEESDTKLPGDVGSLVNSLLPDRFPPELSASYQNHTLTIGIQDENTCFKLTKVSENTALLFAFQFEENQALSSESGLAGTIKGILGKIADFFGIRDFIFYLHTGKQSLLQQMLGGRVQMKQLPGTLQAYTMLTFAKIDFEGGSVFCKAVRTLFGVGSTELYLGIAAQKTTCMITLPKIRTGYIESNDLYILLEFGRTMQFVIKGRFVFPYLSGMEFTVDCGVTEAAFRIEALAHVERPVGLFGPFSIGDTCLMIQAGAGLEFGLYSSLYIRNIQLFGAVMLKITGNVIEPKLVSIAVSDLSIPILADNLLGEHIEGIEALDFIRILGLPFQEMKEFPMEQVRNRETAAVVARFNEEITSKFLQLDETQVQITPLSEGADLADLKRMRHYYIDRSGKLQLTAQFYYASENTGLGNYSIEKGLFICGVIEIFKKRFEVLFSLRESEGILAYAKVPAMDLGFISIGASKFQKDSSTMLPVAEDSLLAQFINPQQEGMVFFLSAGKKEVSFYFDGSVEILRLFRTDARILFMNRKIAVDLYTELYGILRLSLHLQVDYSSFSSGNFEFCLILDTSGLTEKLTAVTQKIDAAVSKLRSKIDDARREADRAQNHVNELYGQIAYFDGKIAECKRTVSRASWWKKAFVAIAKGVEIGAYEVAKLGIYTAIGMATAALEVAKGILSLAGKVGEKVLEAVNAVIKGAMSLFYINYIKLNAKADLHEQYFKAEIDFVVLGKKYNLSKQIGKKSLEESPAGALSGAINEHIDSDISHMEDGSFRSSWRKYQYKQYTVEQNSRRLEQVKAHLDSSVRLMKSMQNTYVKEMQIPLEESDEMNISLVRALDQVENVLETGAQAGNVAALGNAMGGLKRSVAAQEKKGIYRDNELEETKGLIARYDEARGFYDEILDNVKAVRRYRNDMLKHHEKMYKQADMGETVMNDTAGDMGRVILLVEQQMYDAFPVNRSGADMINLSREAYLRQCFMDAEERLGVAPDRKVQAMRSRSRKGDYHNRLS